MKKITVMLLAAVLGLSCVGCAGKSAQAEITTRPQEETVSDQETGAEDVLMGGWTVAEDPTVTPELARLCGKAVEGLVGAQYTPVALLATQVVAGTNYAILCQATVVYPDAEPYYAIVYIAQGLEGQTEVMEIENLE